MPREDEEWEYGDEQDDLGDQDPDGDGASTEEELPEELAARLEAEKAKLKAQYEDEFNQHKAKYGRRFGTLLEQMREAGFDAAEDGALVIRDPQTAMQKLVAAPQQKPKQEEDPEPDMWAETEKWKAWQRKQAAKEAEAALAPQIGELKQMMAQLVQSQTQQVIPAAAQTARDYLDTLGLGQFAEHPDFEDAFGKAMQSVPQEHWNNPLAVQTAAMTLIPVLASRPAGSNSAPRRDPREVAANVYRQSAQSTGRTRPTSRAPESDVTAEERELAELSGMSVAEWRAMESPESALEHFSRRNGRQAAGRR
jgi:hypothetical protein